MTRASGALRQQRWRDTLGLLSLFVHPSRTRARTVYDILATHNTLAEESLYLNLGYWERARTYDRACEAMARLLAERAELREGDEILDVGFGFADQDLYWLETFAPARIGGLNIAPRQVEIARRRAAERGWAHRVDLRVGSATAMPFGAETFDKVMALETAFHFDTREDFFREAYRVLRPGGRLALADVIPMPDRRRRAQDRLAEFVGRAFWQIPRANMYAGSAYVAKLRGAGFEAPMLWSIREMVYGPFARYARTRLAVPAVARRLHPLIRLLWRASVRSESAYAGLDYVVVTADKPGRARRDA